MTIQRSKAGLGTFADICTAATEPYSCAFVTTAGATPDGSYDLRAVAADAAGNSTTSAIVTRQVDNSVPSVSLVDPGAFLRGTVTLQADAFAGSGVNQVAIQRAAPGSGTYTTICTDLGSPYGCAWDTTAQADGLYDLRAVMTYASGTTVTSAIVAGRRVDNAPAAGYDVQAENRAGGRAGRVEIGDVLVLTWTRPMNITTLLAGWNGTGTANLTVKLLDGSVSGIGTGGGADALAAAHVGGRCERPRPAQRKGGPDQVEEDHGLHGDRHPEHGEHRRHRSDGHAHHARDDHERQQERPHDERDPGHGLDAELDRARHAGQHLLGRTADRARARGSRLLMRSTCRRS